MSNMVLGESFVGITCRDQRFLADPQISIVRRYDYINDMAERWILESSKEEKSQVKQEISYSTEDNDMIQEDKEQVVSLPIDDCCKRRSRR